MRTGAEAPVRVDLPFLFWLLLMTELPVKRPNVLLNTAMVSMTLNHCCRYSDVYEDRGDKRLMEYLGVVMPYNG